MKGIIIGAGRGRRLMPYTQEQPKCFAELAGQRLLDWVLAGLRAGGLDDLVFIGGYRIDDVRAAYPSLTFRHNDAWPDNNILASLFCAEADMVDGFVSTYSDIVFAPGYVRAVLDHPGDIVLGVDTAWRTRYADRSQHPESDAEKVMAEGDRVVRVARTIAPSLARGEFIGVAKFSARGAAWLREHYADVSVHHAAGAFQGSQSLRKAYLIDMLQELVERGVTIHLAPVEGGYFEIDTTEDYELAKAGWPPADADAGGTP